MAIATRRIQANGFDFALDEAGEWNAILSEWLAAER